MTFPQMLVLAVPVIIFATFFWLAVKLRRASVNNLRALAEQLGMEFVAPAGLFKGSPRATGTLRGKPVEVFTYARSGGKSSTTWSAVTARPTRTNGLTFGFSALGKGSLFRKLDEMLGHHPLTTGDAAFDAVWVVRSNRPEFFAVALFPELRAKLMAAYAAGSWGNLALKDDVVKYVEIGGITTARCARFPALLEIVCDLAEIAEVAPDGDGAEKEI